MNRKKIIATAAGVVIGLVCIYNSVYFTNLTERREELARQNFSPAQLVDQFWNEELDNTTQRAIGLNMFDSLLVTNPTELYEKYGKTLGIGAPSSVLVKGEAVIDSVGEEKFTIRPVGKARYAVQTSFIFSNTIREASGDFSIDDFENTMDFNMISAEINKRIVDNIVGKVKDQLVPGASVEFWGAADVNLKKIPITSIEIVPLKLKVVSHE